ARARRSRRAGKNGCTARTAHVRWGRYSHPTAKLEESRGCDGHARYTASQRRPAPPERVGEATGLALPERLSVGGRSLVALGFPTEVECLGSRGGNGYSLEGVHGHDEFFPGTLAGAAGAAPEPAPGPAAAVRRGNRRRHRHLRERPQLLPQAAGPGN